MSEFRDQFGDFVDGFKDVGAAQDMLIEAGLVVTLGVDEEDEVAITPRGLTVWRCLTLILRSEARLVEEILGLPDA